MSSCFSIVIFLLPGYVHVSFSPSMSHVCWMLLNVWDYSLALIPFDSRLRSSLMLRLMFSESLVPLVSFRTCSPALLSGPNNRRIPKRKVSSRQLPFPRLSHPSSSFSSEALSGPTGIDAFCPSHASGVPVHLPTQWSRKDGTNRWSFRWFHELVARKFWFPFRLPNSLFARETSLRKAYQSVTR